MPANAPEQNNSPFMAGAWRVEPALDRIRCGEETRTLRPQVMELLVYLAARPNEAVSTDQLLEDLWDGRVVTEGSVYNCVGELRSALTIDGDDSPTIETLPRKGYRLLLPVSEVAVSSEPHSRPWLIAASIVVVIAAVTYWLYEPRPQSSQIEALVVLPLDNLSPNPNENAYFTDGMTEALIARLSQLSDVRVISRTSAMRLKDSEMTLPEIAEFLDVDGVIEGSILTIDDEIRLTLQLIDGRTDTHLWTNSYVREVDDILDLQDAVAEQIAAELNALIGSESIAVEQTRPVAASAEAYRAYLKGRFHFNSHAVDSFEEAIAQFDEAIRLDPEFALAYAARSEICNQPAVVMGGLMTLDDCLADARRAVELDPNLSEARAALGFIQLIVGQPEEGVGNLEAAIRLNPNSVMARQWHTFALLSQGRLEEALEQIRIAETLDPLNLLVRTMVGWPLHGMRRYEEAIAQWDTVIELDPDFMLAHYNRGATYIVLDDVDEVFASADAIASINGEEAFEARILRASAYAMSGEDDKARELLSAIENEHGTMMAAWIASVNLLLGDEETALTWLERGAADGSPDMGTIGEERFDSVRDHPRFKALGGAASATE